MLTTYQIVALIAAVVTIVIILWRIRHLSLQELAVRTLAVVIGLAIGALASAPLSQLPSPYNGYAPLVAAVFAVLLLSWIATDHHESIVAAIPHLQNMPGRKSATPGSKAPVVRHPAQRILIDTSATIDGRIADIVAAGFIPGTLVAPKFMLAELQNIADSEDAMRRGRGRRGLEVLNRLREMPGVDIEVLDEDVPGVREVDAKLVTIAHKYGWSVLTTDYNLNRVAQIQGVKILNVNELSNAIRPEVLPGEEMTVKIVQLGKERGQGVGYLADGTMVVVDNGDKLVGQDVPVEITRAFQTVAGKMIFAAPKAGFVGVAQPQPQPTKSAPMPPVSPQERPAQASSPRSQQPRRQNRPKQPGNAAVQPGQAVTPQSFKTAEKRSDQTAPEVPTAPFVNGSVVTARGAAAPKPMAPAKPQAQQPQRPKRRQGSAAIEDRLVQANQMSPTEPVA